MDKISWVMLLFIVATMFYFIMLGMGGMMNTKDYFVAFGFAILVTVVLVALMCIPVVLYCFMVKKIPDIDYSIWAASAFTLVGIISEFI